MIGIIISLALSCIILIGISIHIYRKAVHNQLAINNKQIVETRDTLQQIIREQEKNENRLQQIKIQTKLAEQEYNNKIIEQNNTLNQLYEDSYNQKMEFLNIQLEKEKKALQQRLNDEKDNLITIYQDDLTEQKEKYKVQINNLANDLSFQKMKFDGILAPLKLYEQEQQQKLFYTIQVPDEYHQDIEFLLTTVAEKIQHPDVINKLIWSEYVKPYLEETFKRVGIEEKPGIYKLTNISDGKTYIGKSVNVKKRIADHFKSVVGIKTIADQMVHHAIFNTGFWNWTIEVVTYCDKEQLNELEKYYIEFFKAQDWGYNKTGGG